MSPAGVAPADRQLARLARRAGRLVVEAMQAYGYSQCGVVPPGSWSVPPDGPDLRIPAAAVPPGPRVPAARLPQSPVILTSDPG